MTPRFNPEVNDYWMCDIGRFDYRWIEGDERLQRPLLRTEAGTRADRLAERDFQDRGQGHGGRRPCCAASSCRVTRRSRSSCSSAGSAVRWASPRMASRSRGGGARSRSRRTSSSDSGRRPLNLLGAADLGFPVRRTATGDLDLPRSPEILAGANALYVFDPGTEGSIGDVSWIIEARRSGALKHLIVQGALPRRSRRPPTSCCPAPPGSRRTDPSSTERDGAGAARHRSSGRSDGRLADFRQRRRRPRRAVELSQAMKCAPTCLGSAEQRTVCGAHQPGICAAGIGPDVAAGLESVGALEVGLHVPGPAAGEVPRQAGDDVLHRAAGHDENGIGRHESACRTAASYPGRERSCGDIFRLRG